MSTQAEQAAPRAGAPARASRAWAVVAASVAAGTIFGYAMGSLAGRRQAAAGAPQISARFTQARDSGRLVEELRALRGQAEQLRHGAEKSAAAAELDQAGLVARLDQLEARLLRLEAAGADKAPTGAIGAAARSLDAKAFDAKPSKPSGAGHRAQRHAKLTSAQSSRGHENMSTPEGFNDIGLDDLEAGLANGSVLLVDVREAEEYAAGHIKGALFNPLSKFDPAKLPAAQPGKKVVIYCRSGRRSVTAMEQARLSGRRDADTHYPGGILGWIGAGKPVEQGM